ncbi:uncharacterized protein [Musca autumnalis]|uniref:uncharacterized protein n=1 Tax=Musca autumnalis TaxID=221902 RepID=UPI003CEF9BA0
MDRFRTTFTLYDNTHPQRRQTVRTEETIAAVEQSVEEDPNESIRHRAKQLELCPSTLWKILRKDLGLRPYKIQLVQELKPRDHAMRRDFGVWAENEIDLDADFHHKILFNLETPLHPQKLTVWCALWAGGVIGPYFFRNNAGEAVTVNGDRYRAMITDYFVSELDGMNVDELWFQQDGATCHTAHVTIDLLKETFDERIISRNGPVNWPPRSCDLTPLDYFLWGYVKSLIYANKPETLGELEANIRGVIADIRPHMLEKVVENWTSRIGFIRASRGDLMPEIIFKH